LLGVLVLVLVLWHSFEGVALAQWVGLVVEEESAIASSETCERNRKEKKKDVIGSNRGQPQQAVIC